MPAAPPTPLDQREAELFAGREAELRLFEDRFDPPPAKGERRVLLFTGVGGLGKSALARRIVRKLKADHAERPAAWAAIDFAEAGATDPVQACLQIRLQLGAGLKGARFPIFDVAFARYHQERYPGSDVRRQFAALDTNGAVARRLLRNLPDAAQDGELWKGVTESVVGLIGELPLVGFGYEQANKLFQRGEEWWDRRARPLLAQIDQLSPDQIAAHLPLCLGADLQDVIAGMAHRLPIAVIGDTAEAFHHGQGFQSGVGAFHNGAWLRELVWHSPGVLFVLLGRDPLEWQDHEHSKVRDWRRIIETRPVAPLSEIEAHRILEGFPVPEAAIRERMAAGFAGLPFYIGLQLDLYLDHQRAGQTPSPDAFGGAPDAIVTRFLSHLDQRIERSLVALAHARRFDEPLHRELRKEHPELVSDARFGELTRYSFVESGGDGSWRLHQLMRDILQSRLFEDEPADAKAVHEALFAYWDARCQPESAHVINRGHEQALEEAAYHVAALDAGRLVAWLFERWLRFFDAGRYGVVLRLWEQASAAAEVLHGPDHPEVGRALGNLGNVRHRLADWAGAHEAYEKALGVFERVYGPDHPEVARALGNLGLSRRDLGDLAGARDAHERALSINERAYGPDHPEVAHTLGNLGNLRRRLGDLAGAREALELTLSIVERASGADHPEVARALANLGNVRQLLGDLAGAREALERALGIQERAYGPDHPDVAGMLHNLSNCLEQLGQKMQAWPLRRRALAISEAKLGPGHPSTRAARRALKRMEDGA